MKKRILFLILPLFCFCNMHAQSVATEYDLPESIFNLGVGVGLNYGGLGTKAVLGYRNTGLMAGLGYLPGGNIGAQIGVQISYDWVYANVGYGSVGTVETFSYNYGSSISTNNGINIMLGGMISLGRYKKYFIDLALGFKSGVFDHSPLSVALGFGYRFGDM